MHQLVYVSTASWAMSDADLNDILDASRRNNRTKSVTGLLLYLDHGFLQVLEGPKAAVEETYAIICRDRRHSGPRILIAQDVEERLFGSWSMGFERLSEDYVRTADVFAITREAIDNAITPERAAEIAALLRNFYRINAGQYAA